MNKKVPDTQSPIFIKSNNMSQADCGIYSITEEEQLVRHSKGALNETIKQI